MKFWAPTAVIVCHVAIALICLLYDPGLFWGIRGLLSVSLLSIAIYALWLCTGNPGFLTVSDELELSESVEHQKLQLPIKSRSEQNVVELRFCTVCQLTQPIRTKHCSDCNACVRTYDHHCPWIGTCVGENNRHLFLVYLWCEFFTLFWFISNAMMGILEHAGDRTKLGPMALLIFAIMVMSVFLLMTGLLGTYHVFLCVSNLTTWEHSAWNRITYLDDLKESKGSPFSHSTVLGNVRMYFGRLVQRDSQGWIVWRIGPQHTVVPNIFRNCCDSC